MKKNDRNGKKLNSINEDEVFFLTWNSKTLYRVVTKNGNLVTIDSEDSKVTKQLHGNITVYVKI